MRSESSKIHQWKYDYSGSPSCEELAICSSGEAELCALTKCATQVLGITSFMIDFGMDTRARIHTDISPVLGMVHRDSIRRARHIGVQFLCIQAQVKEKTFDVNKINTN